MPIIMFAKGFSFRQACAYVLINQILTNIKWWINTIRWLLWLYKIYKMKLGIIMGSQRDALGHRNRVFCFVFGVKNSVGTLASVFKHTYVFMYYENQENFI